MFTAHTPSSTQSMSMPTMDPGTLADLLRPESFDWSEEMEHIAEDHVSLTSDAVANILRPQSFDWSEEIDEVAEVAMESTLDTNTSSVNYALTSPIENAQVSKDYNGLDDKNVTETQSIIEAEYARRDLAIAQDADIHHFNWFGQPVYERSTTDSADSLVFIQAPARVGLGSNEYRVHSILNRAMHYIDPVLLLLDDEQKQEILHLHGSELARAASGSVYRYYSPHGRWMVDEEDGKQSVLDHGNAQIYLSPDLAIGNGIVERTPLQSMPEWLEGRDEALRMAEALAGRPRRTDWIHKSSPLQQVISSPNSEELSHDSALSSPDSGSMSPLVGPSTSLKIPSSSSSFSVALPSPALDITNHTKSADPPPPLFLLQHTPPPSAPFPRGSPATDLLPAASKHAPRKRSKREQDQNEAFAGCSRRMGEMRWWQWLMMEYCKMSTP